LPKTQENMHEYCLLQSTSLKTLFTFLSGDPFTIDQARHIVMIVSQVRNTNMFDITKFTNDVT